MRIIVPILMGLCFVQANAQDVDADLLALNTHFSGVATFALDRDDRLATEYLSNGEPYRIDQVYVEFLAPSSFAYNEEEHTVMLLCADDHAKCIDKEIRKTGVISPTGRMNLLPPPGDPHGAKAIELLTRLVNDVQAEQRTSDTGTKKKEKRKK
jgi:hypothetical protein